MNWLSLLGLESLVARGRANVIEGAIAAEDRMDLARLEWQDQKQRLQQMLVLTIVVAGLTVVALIMLSLAVLVHFWDTPHRTMVAWLVAAVWTVGWAATLMSLVSVVQKAGNGFALTRRELAQDWRDIKERLEWRRPLHLHPPCHSLCFPRRRLPSSGCWTALPCNANVFALAGLRGPSRWPWRSGTLGQAAWTNPWRFAPQGLRGSIPWRLRPWQGLPWWQGRAA